MEKQQLVLADSPDLFRLKWEYEREHHLYDDLLCFGTADMDYRSPEPILDTIREIVERGHLGYPMTPDAFYETIHNWLRRSFSWDVDAEAAVEQNVGVYASAWSILETMTSPGDKVTILTPVHFCFKRTLELNRRVAIECPLLYQDGRYTVNLEMLEACFSSGSRVLWLCNPHNPVGRAWTKKELQAIAELCIRYHVLVMSDDVYYGLTFPETVYTPIASLSKEISYQTVTFYSISKTFNTTGLMHSFLVTENPEIMKRYRENLERVELGYGRSTMGIAATITALDQCAEWQSALQAQLQKNFLFLKEFCHEKSLEMQVTASDSCYFAWIDCRPLCIPPQKLAYALLEEEHMVVENGVQLGKGGAGFIRFNFAASGEHLKEGAERLQHFCEHHR